MQARQQLQIFLVLWYFAMLSACAALEGNVPYVPPPTLKGEVRTEPGRTDLAHPGGSTRPASAAQRPSTAPGGQRPPAASAQRSGPEDDLFPLGPEDVLEVSVWNHPELAQTALVGPDGRISLKLIGSMGAGGMTLPELQRELSGRYQEFVPEAEVSVSLKELNSFRVYVLGKVASPGEYKVRSRLSALQALALAGGLNPFAKDRALRIMRRAGSRDVVLPFDYRAVMEGTAPDLVLQPGDRILVP